MRVDGSFGACLTRPRISVRSSSIFSRERWKFRREKIDARSERKKSNFSTMTLCIRRGPITRGEFERNNRGHSGRLWARGRALSSRTTGSEQCEDRETTKRTKHANGRRIHAVHTRGQFDVQLDYADAWTIYRRADDIHHDRYGFHREL